MALFKKLSTARQSVIIDDIENLQSQINSKEDDITALQDRLDIGVAKINALQSLMTSHTSQLKTKDDTLALNLKIDNETIKTVALQSLTESHTSQITSHDGDINDLQGRLEILNDTLSNKQDTLTAGDNINIVNNVISSDEEVSQADLDLKQDLIQDGDLTIAKTDGLLTALDSTAKLASLNTFTGLQTVNGDLKADHVLVKITAPILNTHLTSKLYVDTALIGKQNTWTAGTGIDITDNIISSSSSSSFVGFRAVTSQAVDLNVDINTVIPHTPSLQDIVVIGFLIWTFFFAEYAETFRRVHLRVTRGAISFDPLQVGNYNTQINMLSGTIPVL